MLTRSHLIKNKITKSLSYHTKENIYFIHSIYMLSIIINYYIIIILHSIKIIYENKIIILYPIDT